MSIIIPDGYKSPSSIKETEISIKEVKDYFERMLAKELNLTRVSAPLFVTEKSGLNDNLNGVERPVRFGIREQNDSEVEIVHSLAKWKRKALRDYGFKTGEGLYTDMTAIRRDEDTDNLHSLYVDQWDWELIISKKDRTVSTLKSIVRKVYEALKNTEVFINSRHPEIERILPESIKFITTQELLDRWPRMSPKERETAAAKEYGAIFLMQIGDKLSNGKPHDGRAPDYDDWALNGDIIVYYPLLDMGFEISSMGIRVDEDSLKEQLKKAKCQERAKLPFHKAILEKNMPYTVGGGIGQSRICMFFLRRAHIGEVQSSIWLDKDRKAAESAGITLL
ncbi:MAG: aspartate--ammonia ligase [Lachnospiraceae bacterium]|nr:aspartate--ammonia ligase [Lachnospiraceae bacterium]